MKMETDLLIIAKNIFDGILDEAKEGYISISQNVITEVAWGRPKEALLRKAKKVITFENELVMPGITDTHTFFTGYAINHLGLDAAGISNDKEAEGILEEYARTGERGQAIFGHGWNPEQWEQSQAEIVVERMFPDRPVILFSGDRSTCLMNSCARKEYRFTPDKCYPEAYYRIMKEYLTDEAFIGPEFRRYRKMMNARGVTTVKEMGFDDFYGFTDYLKKMEESEELSLRIFFMSQPVGQNMNLDYAKKMRKMFTGDKVRFSGFNCMTDGTIADYRGDLLSAYEGKDFCCGIEIDYAAIEKNVLKADEEGFRFSLHAQGDRAVHKAVEIYDKCKKENGKLINKHAITDMEFTHPADLKKMGELGVTAELYFQIMSLDSGQVVKENIKRTIGLERGKYYWNRRKMADEGITLSGATDLPLMLTSVPESVYYSCGGYFPEGGEPFQKENTLSVAELLKAWTIGGQKNLGMEDKLGTLEAGKFADIVVFNSNLLDIPLSKAGEAKVIMTLVDGKIVYQAQQEDKMGF
ncbi:amidohydrolase [Anaerocolumna jejuensis]|uniref:amidohydrolase n=1 Tax=Anaerocolumna jejuensis TaxID=259063 RepID=UPI003F7C4144